MNYLQESNWLKELYIQRRYRWQEFKKKKRYKKIRRLNRKVNK